MPTLRVLSAFLSSGSCASRMGSFAASLPAQTVPETSIAATAAVKGFLMVPPLSRLQGYAPGRGVSPTGCTPGVCGIHLHRARLGHAGAPVDTVDPKGFQLSLELELPEVLGLEPLTQPPQGRLTHEYPAGCVEVIRRELLAAEAFQARSGVNGVAVAVVLHAVRGAEAASHHRPGQDADAHGDQRQPALLEALVEDDQAGLHGERAFDRIDRIARDLLFRGARHRHPEDRHDRVADETQDHAAVRADDRGDRLHEAVEPV